VLTKDIRAERVEWNPLAICQFSLADEHARRQRRANDSRTQASPLELFPREKSCPRTGTKRNFFGNTGDALIPEPDDSDIFSASLVPHNIPWFKIGDH